MQTNIQQWQFVVAFFVPIIVAAINRSEWRAGLKVICMLVVSAIVAGVGLYLQGSLNPADLIGSALTIAVATIVFFQGVYRPTGLADAIETHMNVLPAAAGKIG